MSVWASRLTQHNDNNRGSGGSGYLSKFEQIIALNGNSNEQKIKFLFYLQDIELLRALVLSKEPLLLTDNG